MSYFTYDPGAETVALFGAEHTAALLFAGAACILLGIAARRMASPARRRAELIVVALIVLSEAARMAILAVNGALTADQLPLHLCGLAVFISLAYAARPLPLLGELLYCLCMPGALFALLFPGWAGLPGNSFFSANSFFAHTLLLAYPIMLLTSGNLRPDARRLPLCFAALAAAAAPLYFVNKLTGANYFFLRYPSPGSPLQFFASFLGETWYILGYLPMIAAVWAVLYLPICLRGRRAG